jgi:hypothetical protein
MMLRVQFIDRLELDYEPSLDQDINEAFAHLSTLVHDGDRGLTLVSDLKVTKLERQSSLVDRFG